jgi:hypothetical protein
MFKGWGLLIISLLYAFFFVWLGRKLWNDPNYQIVGGLLHVVAVCLTPLAVYGFQLATGFWIDPTTTETDTPIFRDYQYKIKVFHPLILSVSVFQCLFFIIFDLLSQSLLGMLGCDGNRYFGGWTYRDFFGSFSISRSSNLRHTLVYVCKFAYFIVYVFFSALFSSIC